MFSLLEIIKMYEPENWVLRALKIKLYININTNHALEQKLLAINFIVPISNAYILSHYSIGPLQTDRQQCFAVQTRKLNDSSSQESSWLWVCYWALSNKLSYRARKTKELLILPFCRRNLNILFSLIEHWVPSTFLGI